MADSVGEIRVTLAVDGFYPQAFRWSGRSLRVLFVEGLRTSGPERRFRVRTVEGVYELIRRTDTGVWQMRRSPSWFGRTLAQMASAPRYSLPATRRRAGCIQLASGQIKKTRSSEGGGHANGVALVR